MAMQIWTCLYKKTMFKCLMHSPSCTCSNDPNSKHAHGINEFHGSGPPNYHKHTINSNHHFKTKCTIDTNKHFRHTDGPSCQSSL
jgi:hypothetical protein